MTDKQLCKICVNERLDIESQGYIPNGRGKYQDMRTWYYVDPKRNKSASIVLDLNLKLLRVYVNGRLKKEIL